MASISFLFLLYTTLVWKVSALPRLTGVVQRSDKDLLCPHTIGVHLLFRWADIEPENGQFDFSDFDSRLKAIAKIGKAFSYTVETGFSVPQWIFTAGVPRVVVDFPGRGNITFPYYLDETYISFFRRMVTTVSSHVSSLEESLRGLLSGVDVVLGSTGDVTPWHGQPLNPKYNIDRDVWLEFWSNETLFYAEEYSNLTLNPEQVFFLFLHGLEDIAGLSEKVAEIATNYHFSDAAHEICKQYQETNERMFLLQNDTTYNLTHTLQHSKYYIKAHCFQDKGLREGYMNPITSAWATFHWALTWNMDRIFLMDWEYDGDFNTSQLWPMLAFVNKYSGIREAANSPGAWVRFHDGLDSADTERFPESEFGKADLKNADRMVEITKAFSDVGAAQDDPVHAAMGTQSGRQRTGWNDAGWQILADNYGLFLKQWQPLNSSVGLWRVGKPNSSEDNAYWGRFARAFQHSSGKDDMFFDINDELAQVMRSTGHVYVRVVYYDDKPGKWALLYDSEAGCKQAFSVIKSGSVKWKVFETSLIQVGLKNRCPHETDVQLSSVDEKDDTFAFLELSLTPFK